MLTSTASTPSQLSMANPRQIAATAATSGAVMYTVPAGKKFVGYIYGYSVYNATYTITPSGGAAISQKASLTGYSGASTVPFQLILLPGTIITNTAAVEIFLIGIESDL